MSHDLNRLESKLDTDVSLDRTMVQRTTPSGERTSSASGTLVSELERLATLKRAGDLTAKEFKRAKKQLLDTKTSSEAT